MATSSTNWKPVALPSLAFRLGRLAATTPRNIASSTRFYFPPKNLSSVSSAFKSGRQRAGIARSLRSIRRGQYHPFRRALANFPKKHPILTGIAAYLGASKLLTGARKEYE